MNEDRGPSCMGCLIWGIGALFVLWVLDWIGKLVGIE